jgi:hypothetical protein
LVSPQREHLFSGTGTKAVRAAFLARRTLAAFVLQLRHEFDRPERLPRFLEKAAAGFTTLHSPQRCWAGI